MTRDTKAFTAAIRTRVFSFLRAWSIGKDEAALDAVDSPADGDGAPWTVERLKAAWEAHRAEHGGLRLDPEARNLRHTHVEPSEDGATWRVQQMLVDTEDVNDWVLELEADLPASREAGEPVQAAATREPGLRGAGTSFVPGVSRGARRRAPG